MTEPTPKPGILDIELYVGGRSAVPGVAKVYKLSSNESPLGPSPAAVAALASRALDDDDGLYTAITDRTNSKASGTTRLVSRVYPASTEHTNRPRATSAPLRTGHCARH